MGIFAHCSRVLIQPQRLISISMCTRTHIHTQAHTHTRVSTCMHTASAQVAASAARTADAVLITGRDRWADIILKQSPAREWKLTGAVTALLSLDEAWVWLNKLSFNFKIIWEWCSSQLISRGKELLTSFLLSQWRELLLAYRSPQYQSIYCVQHWSCFTTTHRRQP